MRPSIVVTVVALLLALAPAPAQARVGERDSPPGQVYVWVNNARQQLAVDLKAFRRLFELVKAVRARPRAFDGGLSGATAMPDVMIFQEMREANLEIFRRLLMQRSKFRYEIVTAEGSMDRFLYNSDRMTPQGLPQTIVDPCRSSGDNARQYLAQRFTENATGAPLTVVGVHFKAKYHETGQPQCRERNVQAIKTAVVADAGPVVVGGDFNKRPVEVESTCDPNEESPSLEWYRMLTEPQDLSRVFVDTVREVHRARNSSMASEWTFERLNTSNICDGSTGYRRTRLDYLFASGAVVADAHADHPGWSTSTPGAVPLGKQRYSDHRWVTARLILSGVPRVEPPETELEAGGTVQVAWAPVEGAAGYVVYRGKGRNAFERLGVVSADQTSYQDRGKHGVTYRYSVAALGAESSQGRESPGTKVTPDARGPRVTATSPSRGAAGVDPRTRIRVWFGEGVDPTSVGDSTIRVYSKGNRVRGRVKRVSGRQLSFAPARPWRKGRTFYVVVRPVADRLGNEGPRHTFSFSTPEPKKKARNKKRG